MSRSGYSDDCEHLELWRAAVKRATFGVRGQQFLHKLRDALDNMSVKRLIADTLVDDAGEVCALGAVDPAANLDPHDRVAVAKHFNIAPALAAEIAYINDEWLQSAAEVAYINDEWLQSNSYETPEQRWKRMRRWVELQIGPGDAE